MEGQTTISVPPELRSSFFFSQNNVPWNNKHYDQLNLDDPFFYELAFYNHIDIQRPWDHQEESIPLLITEWKKLRESIEVLIRTRDMISLELPMKKGIVLFIEFVHWSNALPVLLSPEIQFDSLPLKPVNVKERVCFICNRLSSYHAYKQLNELMLELEKQYWKMKAINKSK